MRREQRRGEVEARGSRGERERGAEAVARGKKKEARGRRRGGWRRGARGRRRRGGEEEELAVRSDAKQYRPSDLKQYRPSDLNNKHKYLSPLPHSLTRISLSLTGNSLSRPSLALPFS